MQSAIGNVDCWGTVRWSGRTGGKQEYTTQKIVVRNVYNQGKGKGKTFFLNGNLNLFSRAHFELRVFNDSASKPMTEPYNQSVGVNTLLR